MNTNTEQPPCRCEFLCIREKIRQPSKCGATKQSKKKAVNYRTTPLFYEPKLFKLDPAFFVEESEYSDEESEYFGEELEYSEEISDTSEKESEPFEVRKQSNVEKRGSSEENQPFEEASPYFVEETMSSQETFIQQPQYSEAGSSYLTHQAPYMSQQYHPQQPHFALQTSYTKPVPSYYGTQTQYYKPMPPYYAPMPLYYGPAAFQCGIVPGYNRHY
ncbi:unnamed protein product [Spodoptera exigua]|nr:unnamed protein product [Spodoptera exigua]